MSNEDGGSTDEEGLTYAEAGVDIGASEAATAALADAVSGLDPGGYAGRIDLGDRYLGLTTDGVGTKLIVAAAIGRYDTVGIDCIAMNANDLVAAGIEPVAFVDYLAIDDPAPAVTEAIGEGLATGAERAGVALVGGETAVLPEIVDGFDLAGACVGVADPDEPFAGRAEPGDALVGWRSSGIHSNGLTLAREALTREHEYTDPFPGGSEDRTVGEVLLEPTRLYTDLLGPMRTHGVRGAAHITGGGWRNLGRLGTHRYRIEDPWPAHAVFGVVQAAGEVPPVEMHRTFNMGTGFVAALPRPRAEALAGATDGRVIGTVDAAETSPGVSIRGLEVPLDAA